MVEEATNGTRDLRHVMTIITGVTLGIGEETVWTVARRRREKDG
jgi:hypothetical protein